MSNAGADSRLPTTTHRRPVHRLPGRTGALPAARPQVPPSLNRALFLLVIYLILVPGGELLAGMDGEDLKASVSHAASGLILPLSLGILAVLAIGSRWRWPGVFIEPPALRLPRWSRWRRPLLSVLALGAAIGLAAAPWAQWPADVLLVLLTGMLLVGVGEELVCRGYLLVGARSRYSERGAFLLSCALFGLIHGTNLVTGQAVSATLGQIVFAFAMGACFYLLRRLTGLLAVAMLAHGLVDVLSLVYAPPA